ncbi:MAG: C1 family peptidase, partial [Bacteroidales bacterium]
MYSQTKQLNQEILNHFREEYKKKSDDYKALRNALSANDLNSITQNRDIVGKADYNFKYKVKVTGITDQKSSGRCWMFTGLNTLRPYVINSKSLNNFEFSTNYLYFYDLLEKSNLFLETCIETALLPEEDKMYALRRS